MTTTPHPAATVALWMATHLGWHVFPLNPGTKTPLGGCTACRGGGGHTAAQCPCLARGDGALCHGVWAATADPAVITRWATRWRTSVWAVHCGVSGLLAVDLDTHGGTAPHQPLNGVPWPQGTPPPADGIDVYAGLAGLREQPLDSGALLTHTPSGGLHLVYTAEPGRWKSSTGAVRPGDTAVRTGLGWQIDIKAYGGYVVIPGSTTEAGTYQRVSTTTRPAPLPVWLADELNRTGHDRHATPAPTSRPAPMPAATTDTSRAQRFADAALRSACAELAAMPPNSGRNRKLFRSASRLAGMVAAGWIDRDHVETALTNAAVHTALPGGEIRYAIASGFRTPRPAHLRSAA
jgi:hypothetical protein